MRAPRFATLGIVLLSGACGSDTTAGPPQAEFEELCGEEGPVRILPIDPERTLHRLSEARFGDRHVFALSFGTDVANLEYEIWSVGTCGEDPIQLIDGVGSFHTYDPWPDIPFVCDRSTGDIFALDPTGVLAPNRVFETQRCSQMVTTEGLLTIAGEADIGPLVLQRWPADPLTEAAEQVVLLEDAKTRPGPDSGWHRMLAHSDSEVLAITSTDDLVSIALDDLEVSVIAPNVREFDHDYGPSRWLVWQSTEVTEEHPSWPEGPILLLDRESGETTQIAETALAFTIGNTMDLHESGLLHVHTGAADDPSGEDIYVRLSTLESVSVSTSLQPIGSIDDTRMLFRDGLSGPPFYMVDIESLEPTLLYDGDSAGVTSFGSEGLTVLSHEGGELLKIPYTGSASVLAEHASRGWQFTSSGGVITPLAVDHEDIGKLVLVEPGTLTETTIVEGAYDFSLGQHEDDDGLTVSYALADRDPERYGIWAAKLAD